MSEPASGRPRGRPRTTGAHTCGRCGHATNKIRVRWPDGQICGPCFTAAASTYRTCGRCGQHRLTPGRAGEQRLRRACAGIATNFDCATCGREGELHRGGNCARCTLRSDLTLLLHPDDPGPCPALARLVEVLTGVDRPASIHTWKRNPDVEHLLQSLGDRTLNRLRTLGINPLGARNAALRELVQQAPAPVVADLLGYSTQITLAHADRAAQPYNRYPHHTGLTKSTT